MLAHNCSILNIGVNFDTLYRGADDDYELCLRVLTEAVGETRRTQQ